MVRLLALLLVLLLLLPSVSRARDETLRLEFVLDPRERPAVEGEMILATIRGIYRGTIAREELKLRRLPDFDWTRLGQDRWRQEMVEGRAARVMERRMAFYPKRAGRLEIPAITHQLELLGAEGRRETRLVRSAPVSIEVQPRPVTGDTLWLPIRGLEISDHWNIDPAVLEDGQLAERRVILRAFGATPEMMPQQPPLREPWLITFSPPEQINMEVTPQGPVTTVEWRWKLRPVTGEAGVIPEVIIPFFDTTRGRAATVTLPASPIGYASFADNARTGWRSNLGPAGLPLAAGLIAFSTALAASLGAGGLGVHPQRVFLARLRTRLLRLKLGLLLRRGRVTEYRRDAALALRKSGVDPDVRETVLSILDGEIFGGYERPPSLQLQEMHRAVREAIDVPPR
jgi:hypothetical protein